VSILKYFNKTLGRQNPPVSATPENEKLVETLNEIVDEGYKRTPQSGK